MILPPKVPGFGLSLQCFFLCNFGLIGQRWIIRETVALELAADRGMASSQMPTDLAQTDRVPQVVDVKTLLQSKMGVGLAGLL